MFRTGLPGIQRVVRQGGVNNAGDGPMKKTIGLGICAVAALALTMGGCSKNSESSCCDGAKEGACCKDAAAKADKTPDANKDMGKTGN